MLPLLLLIPVLWVVFVKFILKTTITLLEAVAILAIGIAVTVGGWQLAKYSEAYDTEFLNGQVTDKKQVWVSCSHSYECNCVTTYSGTGANRTAHRTCQTCYEHSNDWDWDVFTNVGKTITVDRVDRRGSKEPPRWSKVVVGEPIAVEQRFINYIKGARNTVLKDKAVDVTGLAIPPYPRTFDYYRADRVIRVGTAYPQALAEWNIELNEVLRQLGPTKHANIVIVFTSYPESYRFALKQEWVGGKSNDTIVVIGVDGAGNHVWSDAFGWSRSNNLYVDLRHNLADAKNVTDRREVLPMIHKSVQAMYDRRSTSEFEYLAKDFRPGLGLTIGLIIVMLLVLSGVTYYAHTNDVFGGKHPNYKFRRNYFR